MTAAVLPQRDGFNRSMVDQVVKGVLEQLIKRGRLPQGFQLSQHARGPMHLDRLITQMHGQERHWAVSEVKTSLVEHRAAVLWGGPGEGKSTVAIEAAWQLWQDGLCQGGVLKLDVAGESSDCMPVVPLTNDTNPAHCHREYSQLAATSSTCKYAF